MNFQNDFARHGSGTKNVRKTLQLCRQVFRVLSIELDSLGDDTLFDISVESVEPAPDATRLLVILTLSPKSQSSMGEIYAALDRAHARLRSAVAGSITRKRAPELAFQIRAATEVEP